jgi:hypothetical protein
MSRRAWETNWQLAARIAVAEQDIRNRAASLLAEIPALEDRRDILVDVVDGKWPAVEQKNDHWLAQRHHGFDKLFLPPDQVEAGAIAHVVQSPRFARSLLVAANRQHDHVSAFGDLHGFRDLFAVVLGIAGYNFVLVPVAANGDLAAFAVKDFGAVADLGLDAVETETSCLGTPL